MSREIIFRGKRVDSGEWVEGNYCLWCNKPAIQDYLTSNGEIFNVDPATVGQYVGKCDQNGKKIFEGDIIKQLYSEYQRFDVIGAVRFNRAGRFVVDHVWTAEQDPWKEGKKQGFAITSDCEVIGNIHDNPELLEAADE